MNRKDFDVNSYVCQYLKDSGYSTSYIDFESIKESYVKQTIQLLKYFNNIDGLDFFDNSSSAHVLTYFPLSNFQKEDIGKYLTFLFDRKSVIGDKVISQLNKTNVNNTNPSIEGRLRNFEFMSMLKPPISKLHESTEHAKLQCRKLIRTRISDLNEIKIIEKSLIAIILDFLNQIEEEDNISNLYLAADFTSDVLLQLITYWVFTIGLPEHNKSDLIEYIGSYIVNENDRILRELIQSKCAISIEDASHIFTCFLTLRNEFSEYVNIISLLEEEQKNEQALFCEAPRSYRVSKSTAYTIDSIEDLVTEGSRVSNFVAKLDNTKEMIDIFSKYGWRNASPYSALDVKVYFREIYISDSKYKNQAMTIVRKYLSSYLQNGTISHFENQSEYMFLREKLNRGYYRETSSLAIYNSKNKTQKDIYKFHLAALLIYDYKSSLSLYSKYATSVIHEVFDKILSISQNDTFNK